MTSLIAGKQLKKNTNVSPKISFFIVFQFEDKGRKFFQISGIVYVVAGIRGDANYGWLHSRQIFSFADYYNPDRMHVGVLRVLNDDHMEPGMGWKSGIQIKFPSKQSCLKKDQYLWLYQSGILLFLLRAQRG